MLSKRLFLFIHKMAMFAILIASFTPNISHALATHKSMNSMMQEICVSNGAKINLKIQTTLGQQRFVEFAIKPTPQSKTIVMHFAHCPFCASATNDTLLNTAKLPVFVKLISQAQQCIVTKPLSYPSFLTRPPPAQAPPYFI